MRDGRDADLAEPCEPPRRRPEHRVVAEAAQELAVVVVEREREAQPLDRLLAVGDEPERAVRDAGGRRRARRGRRPGAAPSKTPSRNRRVASPACRAVSASEYGPRGRTTTSTISRTLKISFGWPRYALPAWARGCGRPGTPPRPPTASSTTSATPRPRSRSSTRSSPGSATTRAAAPASRSGAASGRMTGLLAERFDRVVAVDVSPLDARAGTRRGCREPT